MPKPPKLKVYRTPIGFHDAYIAAPSQKAALEAWGSDKDLFARGGAEIVTDPDQIAAALAAPGKVIKRLRGTPAEQIAALPPDREDADKAAANPPRRPAPPRVRQPAPSRTALDEAEQRLAGELKAHDAARAALAEREAAIAAERQALEAEHHRRAAELDEARVRQARAYEAAMRRWRG